MWLFSDITARLARIEYKLDRLMGNLGAKTNNIEDQIMSQQATLDELQEKIRINTNVVSAATDALTHYAQTTAELTEQLKQAMANDDEAQIQSAIEALDANNQALASHIGDVADAIVE